MNNFAKNEIQRIGWVDVAKGIGAIYVIIGHFCLNGKIQSCLSAFHMPLFFFLAGITFKLKENEKFICFFKKKFATIMIPYFIFSIPLLIFNIIEIIFEKESLAYHIIRRIIGVFLCWKTTDLYNGIWFLPCMFVTYLYAWVIIKYCKKNYIVIVSIIISSIVGFGLDFMKITLPFGSDTSFIAFSFLGIGYLLKKQLNNIKFWLCMAYFLMIICAFVNVKLSGVSVDMSANNYGNAILFYVASLSGIIGTIGLSKVKHLNRKWLIEIGKESLYLYGSQMLFFAIVLKFQKILYPFSEIERLLIGFLLVAIIFGGCLAMKPIYYKLYNAIIKTYYK